MAILILIGIVMLTIISVFVGFAAGVYMTDKSTWKCLSKTPPSGNNCFYVRLKDGTDEKRVMYSDYNNGFYVVVNGKVSYVFIKPPEDYEWRYI